MLKHSKPCKEAKNVQFLLVILLLVCFAFALSGCQNDKKLPHAAKGVLNLEGWDFVVQGNVDLKGEWEFFLGRIANT